MNKQLKFFNDEKTGFTITNSIFFNKFKNKNFYSLKSNFEKKVFNKLIENYFISFDTVIIKSIYLKQLNHMIDERFNIIHDMDLLIRLSDICEMIYVPFSLSKWRMREESFSYNNFNKIIKEKKIFIKKISRIKKNDLSFDHSKSIYMDTLCRQEILLLLSERKIFKAFSLLNKLKFNIKNIILIFVILLPFKKLIFNKLFNLKY